MFKYKIEKPEPAQESVILGFLFGMFVLPWLFIAGVMTIAAICDKISQFKDKRDPSRKFARLKRRMENGWVHDLFTTEDGDQIDFKQADKTARLQIKDGIDLPDLIVKWGKWSACIADLSKISNMVDADKQIQKIFATHFKNNELFEKKDEKNGVFTGIKVKEIPLQYPDNQWFKPGSIEKFTKFADVESNKIAKCLEAMTNTAKQCIAAPSTHKEEKDKPYLLGCLNYLNTIDKIIDMTNSMVSNTYDASYAVEKVWWKVWD